MLWPVAGYLFLFIFRPWEYWPALAPYRIERVYMLILLALVFLWRQRRYVPHPISGLIMAFFTVLVLSSIAAFRWGDAYAYTFDYFKLIVFYFVIVMTVRDERDMKRFILAYLAIMSLYVGKSVWEFFLHDRYIWRMGLRRLMGVDTSYGDPNDFAASMAYSLPFLWAMIKCRHESPLVRKLLWAYGLLAWAGIILTGSRSGMVTALLFVLLAWFGASKKALSIVFVCMALLITWNLMPERHKLRFESTFIKGIAPKGADISAEGRIAGLKQGIRIFKRYPVLGIGPGNFKYGWNIDGAGGSAHNLYGELLGETGGAGFLVFISLVAVIVRTHKRTMKAADLALAAKLRTDAPSAVGRLRMLKHISTAAVHTIILLLFNGNFGHNLYRYNWLWIGAIGVLATFFMKDELARLDARPAFKARGLGVNGLNALPGQN